jgi:hypothetical protein
VYQTPIFFGVLIYIPLMSQKRKSTVRSKFKKWLAIPKGKREGKTGISTQTEFAEKMGVAKATLSRWKKEPGFMNGVEHTRRLHLDEALSDVYESMIQRAKEGDPQAMKMVMEQAGRWKEDIQEDTDVSEDDLEGSSNQKLAGMMASMLSGAAGEGESVLQARILKSLGDDVPDDLKRQIREESQSGGPVSSSGQNKGEDDEDEADDEVKTEEAGPESEEDGPENGQSDQEEEVADQNEEVEDEGEEFELENHLMEGMDEGGSDTFDPTEEVGGQEEEEDDLEDLDTTEDFEIPLDW